MGATPEDKRSATLTAALPHGDDPERLLEQVARGEREALLILYDRFSPSLLAVAFRITSNRAEAEDILQDVFTRAWREAASFDRARGTAMAWLVTLTRNRSIDIVRARRRRSQHEDAEAEAPPAVEPSSTPELALVDAERAAAVRLALETLRDEQRKVLELAYFGGLSHSEIAERLQQPLGTVKTRIAQAVKRLREELAKFAPLQGAAPTDAAS